MVAAKQQQLGKHPTRQHDTQQMQESRFLLSFVVCAALCSAPKEHMHTEISRNLCAPGQSALREHKTDTGYRYTHTYTVLLDCVQFEYTTASLYMYYTVVSTIHHHCTVLADEIRSVTVCTSLLSC
eukprot:scpid108159/ scgid5793/ 